MQTTYRNDVLVTHDGRRALVYAPTIAILRDVLNDMERAGVALDETLEIGRIANALNTYTFQPLNR